MERLQRHHQAIGFVTPLRYPGGKRKLLSFFRDLIEHNDLQNAHYVEPFAGGAGLALSLLISDYVDVIHLNDLDMAIYAFWRVATERPEELCRRISETAINVEVWRQQRHILEASDDYPEVDVAFATFFLNRTNRSGILWGGVIGGLAQSGKWTLDARLNKVDLIKRIERIARYRERIRLYNQEAISFLQDLPSVLPASAKVLIYADPPYYSKGHTLYYNHYRSSDHQRLARTMQNLSYPWAVSYDDVDPVYELYRRVSYARYQLHYTAQHRRRSGEVVFLRDLVFPAPLLVAHRQRWKPMYVVEYVAKNSRLLGTGQA